MKSSTDIIGAAVYAALTPKPMNYTAAGIAADIVAALSAEGYLILSPAATKGIEIAPPTPDIAALARALAAYDYADGSVEPSDPFVPVASFAVEVLAEMGFAVTSIPADYRPKEAP